MSLPIGVCRRAFSYDDALEDPAPMTPPPSDMGSIPWKPVIPERKYQHLDKTEEGAASVSSLAVTPSTATDSSDKAPVLKAKATHVIMNSLITSKRPWVSAEELREGALAPQLQLVLSPAFVGPHSTGF
ncbi:Putative monooxygenase p33MONOX [Lemmus lemmus]